MLDVFKLQQIAAKIETKADIPADHNNFYYKEKTMKQDQEYVRAGSIARMMGVTKTSVRRWWHHEKIMPPADLIIENEVHCWEKATIAAFIRKRMEEGREVPIEAQRFAGIIDNDSL